jgi:hypothetical protein
MSKSSYVAWTLYTGPKAAKYLWEKSWLMTGEWTGNRPTCSAELKSDIDTRVGYLIEAFKKCRENMLPHLSCATNFFMVPEFYFRCGYGPYPRIAIVEDGENLRPFQYICRQLEKKLTKLKEVDKLFKDGENWIICAGSVLTCNRANIEAFLSEKAAEIDGRLKTLNSEIIKLGDENKCLDKKIPHDFVKVPEYSRPTNPSEAMSRIITLIKEYRADPLCVVRNRGAIFKVGSKAKVEFYQYEKQNESYIDLTMGLCNSDGTIKHGNMITEWMAGYPSISIINGDKNSPIGEYVLSNSPGARITIFDPALFEKKIEIGVEICFDHFLKRLRRTANMTYKNGAADDNPLLDVQLIPSGGMQIHDNAVAAGASGIIFNCDGAYPILSELTPCGKPVINGSQSSLGITCGVYAISAQYVKEVDNQNCYSHSQLSFRYGNKEIAGYNNALGSLNENGQTYDPETGRNQELDGYFPPTRITLSEIDKDSDLFVAGLGELHLYLPPTR